jgi:hypothetical protein
LTVDGISIGYLIHFLQRPKSRQWTVDSGQHFDWLPYSFPVAPEISAVDG